MNRLFIKPELFLLLLMPLAIFAQKAELVVQTGHTDGVAALDFSPDGRLVATGGLDGKIIIWNASDGTEIRSIPSMTESLVFSPDGTTLVSAGDDRIDFWRAATGELIRSFEKKDFSAYSRLALSPDGKFLAVAGYPNSFLLETADGSEIARLPEKLIALDFSSDGRLLAVSHREGISLLDAQTGRVLKSLAGKEYAADSISFSPNGKKLVLAGSGVNRVLDLDGGELKTLGGAKDENFESDTVLFAPDGRTIATKEFRTEKVTVWDAFDLRVLREFPGPENPRWTVRIEPSDAIGYSPDGRIIANGSQDGTVSLWEIGSGRKITRLKARTKSVDRIKALPDGKTIAVLTSGKSGDFRPEIGLWNLETGRKFRNFSGFDPATGPAFTAVSPDLRLLAASGNLNNRAEQYDSKIKIWDLNTGNLLREISGGGRDHVEDLAFSPDGKMIVSLGVDYKQEGGKTVRIEPLDIWSSETGKLLKTLENAEKFRNPVFSSDGRLIIAVAEPLSFSGNRGNLITWGKATVWNATSGEKLRTLDLKVPAEKEYLRSVAPPLYLDHDPTDPSTIDRKFKFKSPDGDDFGGGELTLRDAETGKILASLISLDENDWAVITPSGLFDASPGARHLLHYAVGLETVSLEQMKDLYYVPGLLPKILEGRPLPETALFSGGDLFPLAEYEVPRNGRTEFPLKLTNRGGGIGRVEVLINGKEFIRDARPPGFSPDRTNAVLTIDLKNAPLIDGRDNKIEIITHNRDGSITSRGTPRGSEVLPIGQTRSNAPPNIYLIVGGISDYTGDDLDLRFAAKDAADFARALEIGAVKLFGADRVHLRLLTSDRTDVKFLSSDAGVSPAAKADFEKAFDDFKTAGPNDIFIVYLAGHGVSLRSSRPGTDQYLYLTQEATTTDKTVLSVENVRKAMSISSDELTDLIKRNKALKQVLILDTCAAGAAAESLIAKRDLPVDQIRAIERLKDRTGFFVLMGAAADKVSYEASRYGQGLLTYSLLQALRGARLRENQFADVNLLFSYAQDTVPEMARNIGGIQRPLIIAPDASGSFDIGEFTSEEQKQIPLSAPKPLILKPVLQNRDLDYDDLELTGLLSKELRNSGLAAERGGSESGIVFVEADEMIDAVKPSGSYTVRGERISLTIRLIKNKRPVKTLTFEGRTDQKKELARKIVEAIAGVDFSALSNP
ncbi:MAG: caspase family protein [Pyrinomonadaceae bacterium]